MVREPQVSTAGTVLKNTTVLSVARIISMGLGVVYVAALARYIHAAGMGKIATATSLVSMLILLVNFGFSNLLIRDIAADRRRVGIYVSNALLLRMLLSIVLGVVIFEITRMARYPDDTTLVILIYTFAYVFDSLTDVIVSAFVAFERMEVPAALQVGRDLANIVLSLGAIYLHAGLIAIVLISALVNIVKLGVSLALLKGRLVDSKLQIDLRFCWRLIVGALPFGALLVTGLADRGVDVALLSLYRPAVEVGWFSAANVLVTYLLLLPGQFMNAIFPVFARFNEASRVGLQEAYRNSFRYLLILGFPLWVGTVVTADSGIDLVYGPGFENGATALRIMAFHLLWMHGFANGALLVATGAQSFLAVIEGVGAGLNIAVALLLIPRFGFLGASIAAVVSGIVFSLPIAVICHRRLGISLPYALALKTLASSLLMGAVAALCLREGIGLFVVVLVIGPTVYVAGLRVMRVISVDDVRAAKRMFRAARSAAGGRALEQWVEGIRSRVTGQSADQKSRDR